METNDAMEQVNDMIKQGFDSCRDQVLDIINQVPNDEAEIKKLVDDTNYIFTQYMINMTAIVKGWPNRIGEVLNDIAESHNIIWIWAVKSSVAEATSQAMLVNAIRRRYSHLASALAMLGTSTETCTGHDLACLAQFILEHVKEPNDMYAQLRSSIFKLAQEKRVTEIAEAFTKTPSEIQAATRAATVAIDTNDPQQFREAIELFKGQHEVDAFRTIYYYMVSGVSSAEGKERLKPFFHHLAQVYPNEFSRYFMGILEASIKNDVPDMGAIEMLRELIEWDMAKYVFPDPETIAKFVQQFWSCYNDIIEEIRKNQEDNDNDEANA